MHCINFDDSTECVRFQFGQKKIIHILVILEGSSLLLPSDVAVHH